MAIEIGKIRNVGVVGHGGVGKTSLVEAMLFTAGAVTRLGKVDDGTTTTDFDPDEIKRKISINTAVAYCDYKGHRINLVDTPGYGDFIADARAGLRVVEAAVVVVDAVAGVQVQTEKVWKFASEFDLPRAIVVNRLDRERADFFRTLESLGRRLKGRIVPVHIPVGEESGFRGFVDLVTQKATVFADGKASEAAIPAELADRVKEWREKLVEAAAETDDDLLTKYLEEGSLAEAEMLKALRAGITQGKIVPVLCAAAIKSIGSHALLDLIVHEFPSPVDRGEVTGTDLKTKQAGARAPDAKAPVTALVFKTLSDPHIGKLSLFRVYSGTLKADSTLLNPARGGRERMGHICVAPGQDPEERGGAGAGRDRRGAQAQGHADRRHALRGGAALRAAADHLPRAGDQLRHPAQDPRRRGQDLHRAGPHRRGRPDRPPSLRSRDQAAPDLRRGQPARRDGGRAHEAQVQRRRARCCPRASPTRRRSRAAPRGRASTRSRRAGAASTATPGSGSSRWRGAAASSSSTTSSAARCPATSSRRWRRACATA